VAVAVAVEAGAGPRNEGSDVTMRVGVMASKICQAHAMERKNRGRNMRAKGVANNV
jgi:hypothetical protein